MASMEVGAVCYLDMSLAFSMSSIGIFGHSTSFNELIRNEAIRISYALRHAKETHYQGNQSDDIYVKISIFNTM